jgi:ubiquinone/menaquinone biosynthesis C-methylase UbiE
MSTHRFEAENRKQLKNERRRMMQPAEGILERAAPTRDEVCADIGCGTGYLTLPFSIRCQVVLAVDAQREMLADLMSSAGEFERLKIVPIQAQASELPFSGGCLDRVLMVNMLHEVEDRRAFAGEVERVLRPGGRCTLVDFQRKETSFGPPLHERIEQNEVPGYFLSMRVANLWSFEEFYQFELVRL